MPGWILTSLVFGLALGVAAVANWQSRRPYDERWLKIAPWNGIQFVAILLALLMLAHMVTLATGKPFGRGY